MAIGEFGLDYFRMRNTKEQQDYLFRQQLDLAQELGKPIVIHCRDAQADTQKALKEYYPDRGLRAQLPSAERRHPLLFGNLGGRPDVFSHGFLLGIDGPVTYPNSRSLKENVDAAASGAHRPRNRCPLSAAADLSRTAKRTFLYPDHRRRRSPLLKHKTTEEVARQTTQNARALYRMS